MIAVLHVLIGVIIAWFIVDFFLLSWDIRRNKIFQVYFKIKPNSLKFKVPKIKMQEKESFWFFMIALFACAGLIIAEFVMSPPEPGIVNFIGVAVVFGAGLLRIWSRAVLHEFFTLKVLIHHKHKLIKEGPYSLIRHPGYLSLLLFLLGIALAFSSWFGLALVFLLFVPALLYRIAKEEELMIKKFKKDFIYYMHSTKKLVPYLY